MNDNILLPDVFHMNPQKTNNPKFWNKVKWMPNIVATPLSYALGVFPLDMSQFHNLLQSTRIPTEEKDLIEKFPDSKHIVVLHKGCFYAFDVFDQDGDIMPPNYYLAAIKKILSRPSYESSGVGALTSTDRDTWTNARKRLVELGNAESLKKVDSAIITICLDDWEYDVEKQDKVVMELCCSSNPENRWFDKSVSIIFSNNGLAGINFEHAWGDGVAIMRFFDDLLNDNFKNAYVTDDNVHSFDVNVQEINFSTSDDIKETIKIAKSQHFSHVDSLEFRPFRREGFGKIDCKRAKIGPDALMQLAFQISHLNMKGTFAPTYESCSTAIFKHGRTETVRPLTKQMKFCAESFYRGQSSKKELIELMQQCSKTHMEMTKNAAQGQGWDRHFFALKGLAAKNGQNIPKIFLDPAYKNINHIILSTSTLSSANFGVGGFCPVAPDGFGLGYQIRGQDVGVCSSVYKKNTNADDWVSSLETTFNSLAKTIQT